MKRTRFWLLIWMMVSSQWGIALAASDEKVKWYGVEEATVHFNVKGSQTGKIVRHFKNWGNVQVEINQTEMNMMGMSIPTNQKIITEGEWIINVDLNSKTATKTINPMYGAIRKNMGDKSGVEVGKAYVRAMGGRETGKTAQYAGEKCSIWEMTQMGSLMCVTKDGLTLWVQMNMGGMQMTHIATQVKRGDPGPEEAYEIGAGIEMKPTQDIGEIMKKMKRGSRPSNAPGGPGEPKAPGGSPPPDINKLMEMLKQQGGQ